MPAQLKPIVTFDTNGLARKMGAVMDELPRDVMTALNNVAFLTVPAVRGAIRESFDRPTPFSLNSPRVFKARPSMRPYAEVFLKDAPRFGQKHYLLPEVKGGGRDAKPFEYLIGNSATRLIPAKSVQLDPYGNAPRKLYSSVLSQLNALRDPLQNQTPDSRAKRKKRKQRGGTGKGDFFRVRPGQEGPAAHLAPGVWERVETGFGSAVRPVFVEARSVQYRPRLPFYTVVEQEFSRFYPNELALQIRRSIEKRGGKA